MDEFIVKLLAQLDTSKVIQDYNDLKTKLEKQINIKINLDTSNQNDISKFAEQLQTALSKVSNGKLNLDISQITSALNQVSKNAQQTGKEIGNAVSQGVENGVNKINGKVNSEIQKITNQVNKIQLSMGDGTYESKVDALVAKTNQWTDANGNARISTNELSKAFDQLSTASNNYTNSPTEAHQKALIVSEKELDKQIKIVTNSVRSMNAELAKDSKVSSLHNQLADFMSKNGKTVRYFGNDLRDIFNQTGQGAKLTNQELAILKQRFIDIQNTARNTGKLGKTWFQTLREGMSSFSYWTSSTFLVMKAIQSVKSGLGTVKALDTALVDLKKTTTMTNSELEDFYYSSNKVAKQMGVTTEEIINQAAEFSRLGYSSKEAATQMAKYSSWFKTISPGMSIEQAGDTLTSVMKAFKYDVQDIEKIMSMINTVGNNFAVSNLDISEILTRSSSAMMEANNSLSDTIALGTAATEITRDAASVGIYLPTNIVICC